MENKVELQIHLGSFSDPIKDQLLNQNLTFDEKEIDYCQTLANAIGSLYWAEFITDTVKNKLYDKLFKKIKKTVRIKKVN